MATFDHVNGNITMRIVDNNPTIEFWVLTDSMTYNHDQTWSYAVNGVSSAVLQFDMNNRGTWQKVASFTVTTDQTVRFTMYDTGLGFATYSYTHVVDRASVPPKPAGLVISNVLSTSVNADGAGNGDGGSPIDFWQVGYGTSSTTPTSFKTTDMAGFATITGLTKGTTYYFWFRGHNAKGYGAWSDRVSAKTDDVPAAPGTPVISNVKNTSVDVTFADGSNNGAAIDTREVSYGTNPSYSSAAVTSDGSTTLTGLTPGTTYYIWARTHNVVGWGPYSAKATITTDDVPDKPSTPVLSEIDQTSMRVVFSANGDGGSPILNYRIGYGTSPSAPQTYVTSDLDQVLTGLDAGTTYYVWGQVGNLYGWSPLSASASVRTAAGAWVNVNGVWKEAVPYVNVNGVWKLTKAWAKIAGVWKETK